MTFSQRPLHTNLATMAEAGTSSSPSCPNQPRSKDFKFPMREFGKTKVVINCIRQRFDQPVYKIYQHLEQLLLNAVHGKEYNSDLATVTGVYKYDLEAIRFDIQLDTLHSSLKENGKNMDIHDILEYIKSLSQSDTSLLCEVVTLATLILVMPATNALSE